jgi:hypothetical protein
MGIDCPVKSAWDVGILNWGDQMPISRPVKITDVGIANNQFREQVLGGNLGHHKVMATIGINALGTEAVQELLHLVLNFSDSSFRESFEPYGDRDFIVLTYKGIKIWAKIDTYDLNIEFMSENPADDNLTVRVLTLMLPDEY